MVDTSQDRILATYKVGQSSKIKLRFFFHDADGRLILDFRHFFTNYGVEFPTKRGIYIPYDEFRDNFLPILIEICADKDNINKYIKKDK